MKKHVHRPLFILDFGSQYTQLIARRIRDMGVYCEIHPFHVTEDVFLAAKPVGIILSGGPATVTFATTPRAPDWVFSSGLPVLGICYGMQTMALQLGGAVESGSFGEFGFAALRRMGNNALFCGIEEEVLLEVWMSHGDKVTKLPADFSVICESDNASIAGMAHKEKPWYALQFHPEVTHTKHGTKILEQFVLHLCKAKVDWTPTQVMEELIAEVQALVGEDQVLLGLSGGVDSSVVAALLNKAIGKNLICVFVDTGLLRLDEKQQVLAAFQQYPDLQVIAVDAEAEFLQALQGVSCPEEKRKKIGHTFINVFVEEAKRFPNVRWLAQGTIYSDVIESGQVYPGSNTTAIKSHHNVGGLPEVLPLKLLEPLRTLFKDEVRNIGLALGLPPEWIYRHPFPGVGLGVRILGEVKKVYADMLRRADAIFIHELYQAGLYQKISQAFAVFLPIKTVGVMGDGRRYDYVICLRAVETIDFMTAHWAHLPLDFLGRVSNRIINEVPGISRVLYDISGKPPATIEWE